MLISSQTSLSALDWDMDIMLRQFVSQKEKKTDKSHYYERKTRLKSR